jgi:hypothetical protein
VGYPVFETSSISLGSPAVVLQTAPIATAGVYFISATALLHIDSADFAAYCHISTANTGLNDNNYGGSSAVGNYQQAAITDWFFIDSGDAFQLVCSSNGGDSNTFVNNSAMTATLIDSLDAASVASKPKTRAVASDDPRAPR